MNLPEPIKTTITDETFAGVTYHIRGGLVPELQIELRKLPGGVKRKLAGLDFFVTKALGPGRIAFSRDWPGQCIPLHLARGQALNVREHHFLAATDDLEYSYERVKGVRNMLLGGSGFFIDNFAANNGDAIVWVSGQGNVFEVDLGAAETIDVEAGGWLYKDTSVKLESVSLGLKMGMFAGDHKMTFNRFTGPGRLAIQTMYMDPIEGGEGGPVRDAAAGGVAGAVIGGLLRG